MYNQKLVRLLKLLAAAVLASLFISVGYGAAIVKQKLNQTKQEKVAITTLPPEEKQSDQLTEAAVKEFLIAYYTKKELEENRSRYKPFMTESLYETTLLEEDKPVSQAYKGYVVDQAFLEATIYVDKTNQAAIAQVSYENVLLQEKDNRQGPSTKQRVTANLRLKYLEQDGKLLLSHMEPVVLTDGNQAVLTPYQDSPVSLGETSSSSSTDTEGETNDG
ncbi:hypothetical protein [Streptococcus sp. S784/96/1]|uniref:hypothetical protein n=1 Tax=Streptococcus sp. S784/96/1 TaxID=2653499 RepID=UPI001386F061|nr:hypothetical protein [Streptococcus sp. S784/96/1]